MHEDSQWDVVRQQLHHPDELKKDVDKKFETKFGLLAEPGTPTFNKEVSEELVKFADETRKLFDTLELDVMNHVRVGDIKALMDEIADRARVPRVQFPPAKPVSHMDEMLGGKLTVEEKETLSDDLRYIQKHLIQMLTDLRAVLRERHELQPLLDEHAYQYESAARDEVDEKVATAARTQKVIVARSTPVVQSPVYGSNQNTRLQTNLSAAIAAGGASVREVASERNPVQPDINPLENPQEYVRNFMRFYTQQELPEWGIAVSGADEKLARLSPEKRAIIERELSEGAIAMLMPGKAEQKLHLAKAIEKLKPVWIKNGQRKTVNQTAYWWDHVKKLVDEKSEFLFVDVPENPYVSLTKATQAPDPETCSKTVVAQKALLAQKKRANPHLSAMNIPGFTMMQAWQTNSEFARNPEVREITPIDSNTWTRFLDLPTAAFSSFVFVPDGGFGSGGGQVRFYWKRCGRCESEERFPSRGEGRTLNLILEFIL